MITKRTLLVALVASIGLNWTFSKLKDLAESTLEIAKEVDRLREKINAMEGKSPQYMGGYERNVPVKITSVQ